MKAALVVLLCVPAFVLLAGCSGVSMTDAERVACRTSGCTVWTESELRGLVSRAQSGAYRKGWADSNRQAGRDL